MADAEEQPAEDADTRTEVVGTDKLISLLQQRAKVAVDAGSRVETLAVRCASTPSSSGPAEARTHVASSESLPCQSSLSADSPNMPWKWPLMIGWVYDGGCRGQKGSGCLWA